MNTLKAVIFDVDGTLAETERDGHRVAFNQAFQAAGLNWYWSEALYGELLQVAGGKERIQFYRDRYLPSAPDIPDWQNFVAHLHQAKTHHYTTLLKAGTVQLRPGVQRLIEECRNQGIRLAIATTSRLENAITLLETSLAPDAPEWFEVIAAGDIVPHKKPAPDIYHYVLEKLGLPPEQCLAIEDTEHGLLAAKGAGLRTVITVNSYTCDQDFAIADLVLNHLGEPHLPCEVIVGKLLEQGYFNSPAAQSILLME